MKQPDFEYSVDDSLNITYDRTKQIAETLIISILNNENSIACATRAINSCKKVGQPNPKLFWAYDGTDKKTIKTPEHLKNSERNALDKGNGYQINHYRSCLLFKSHCCLGTLYQN